MKNLLFISLLIFTQNDAFGQEISLNLLPRFSLGATIPSKYEVIQGQSFITTSIKTDFQGSLFAPNGSLVEFDQSTHGLGLDFLVNRTNEESKNAWGFMFGLYQHKYLQYSVFPQFDWKGSTLISQYDFYRTRGFNFAIRRTIFNTKPIGWYFQLGGMYSFQLESLNTRNNGWATTTSESNSYLENGVGITGISSNISPNTLTINPEIGLITKGIIGLEASLSYQIPVGAPLSNSQVTYYQSNRIFGIEKTNITQESIWLNLRLPLRIWTRKKYVQTTTTTTKYEPPVVVKKSPPTPSRKKLQDLCLTIIDSKTKQILPNVRVNIEGRIFFSNKDGMAKIYEVPVGKRGTFTIQLLNYQAGKLDFESFAQDGCQALKVEIDPIEKPKPETVEIDGKIIKKGESVVLNAIQFEQGNSDLLDNAKTELDKVADWMKKYPNLSIELSGHTSNEGDQEENRKLSEDRVIVCKEYIARQVRGSNARIRTIGYGSTRPRVSNNSEENRKKNRRVELKIDSF
ncbi:MAG: OmpA family protein [Arcicella sp.]|nr:OmpA family protein [Arcicella sp.]